MGISNACSTGNAGSIHAIINGETIRFDGGGSYPVKFDKETNVSFMNSAGGTRTFANVKAYAIKIK